MYYHIFNARATNVRLCKRMPYAVWAANYGTRYSDFLKTSAISFVISNRTNYFSVVLKAM